MKEPPEYLADAWQPDPESWPAGGIPYVPQAQAERAVAQALADAEKYKELLLKALRRPSPALETYTKQP